MKAPSKKIVRRRTVQIRRPSHSEPSGFDPLIRAPEAATVLNVGVSTVYRLAADKVIPSIELGGSRRFRRSSLLAWCDQQERKWLAKPDATEGGAA